MTEYDCNKFNNIAIHIIIIVSKAILVNIYYLCMFTVFYFLFVYLIWNLINGPISFLKIFEVANMYDRRQLISIFHNVQK